MSTHVQVNLTVIASEINREHRLAEEHAAQAVDHAIRCGEMLIEAKAQLKHGEWLPWLAANFEGSEDTAGNWMRLARNSERVRNLPSVRQALAHSYLKRSRYFSAAELLFPLALSEPKYALYTAELYRQAGQVERALWVNRLVADQESKIKQRLTLLIE